MHFLADEGTCNENKQRTRGYPPVAIACGYVVRSRYQNTSEYIVTQNKIEYTSFIFASDIA